MKERIKWTWLDKENLSCIKCKAGNDDIGWDENKKVLFCKKCGHKLTDKEELEERVPFVEVQQYGFWLRFISEHFIPCRKCQEELCGIFNDIPNTLDLGNQNCITMHIWRNYDRSQLECSFTLSFVSPSPTSSYEYKPCEKCQKKILVNFSDKEIHIGNDNKPMVELWRKWEVDDQRTEELNKDGLIRFNGKDNFGKCENCGKLEHLKLDNYSDWKCKNCMNEDEQQRPEDTLLDIELTRRKEESK